MPVEREKSKQNIVVLIPTRNREPKYLNATVLSVGRQAQMHHHSVEIVVSDSSSPAFFEKNSKLLDKLKRTLPTVSIQHYAPSSAKPLQDLRELANKAQRIALDHLIPNDGHWGANRNALALLGVFHGGESSAYLHLDDDSPLFKPGDPDWKIERTDEDVLGAFLKGLQKAKGQGKKGFAGWIFGLPGSIVSAQIGEKYEKAKTLMQKLYEGRVFYSGALPAGPARILSFEGMQIPYAPYGIGEDNLHHQAIGGLSFNVHPGESAAKVFHMGWSGFTPTTKQVAEKTVSHKFRKEWRELVKQIAQMGKK